jgi:SAM-dependent methyltransferase
MWNERYAEAFASYGTEPNDFLKQVAERIPSGPVLCLAEGEGRNAVFLAQRGHDVTAVDLSEVGLANAARLAAERGVSIRTVVANLDDYDLGAGRWSAMFPFGRTSRGSYGVASTRLACGPFGPAEPSSSKPTRRINSRVPARAARARPTS